MREDTLLPEVLRLLGGGTVTARLQSDVSRLHGQLQERVTPRQICQQATITPTSEGLRVGSSDLFLMGKDIGTLLANATSCFLFAATLGLEADTLIRYTQERSLSDGVILDAIASVMIEAFCDSQQAKLAERFFLTMRYSPGYGDLPLTIQPSLLAALQTQKTIGLYSNDACLLIPRKSVTAIMGILPHGQQAQTLKSCDTCNIREKCTKREAGTHCGTTGV